MDEFRAAVRANEFPVHWVNGKAVVGELCGPFINALGDSIGRILDKEGSPWEDSAGDGRFRTPSGNIWLPGMSIYPTIEVRKWGRRGGLFIMDEAPILAGHKVWAEEGDLAYQMMWEMAQMGLKEFWLDNGEGIEVTIFEPYPPEHPIHRWRKLIGPLVTEDDYPWLIQAWPS